MNGAEAWPGPTSSNSSTTPSHALPVSKALLFSRFANNRVLAMQFNMIITNGNVPIRNMANIGSNSFMRGYCEGRFADQDLMAVQVEYRTPVWKRLGLVFFAGGGKVSARFPDLH
jgi:hypothetical protein